MSDTDIVVTGLLTQDGAVIQITGPGGKVLVGIENAFRLAMAILDVMRKLEHLEEPEEALPLPIVN